MKTRTNLIAAVLLLFTCVSTFGQVVDPVDKNKIANGGYDLVAYFTDNAAKKGKPEFTEEIDGVKYQFASGEHQRLFKQNPEKYLPVCDGYCAWGVAEKGKRVPVNPETFKVIDGKLYLFFNGDFNGSPFNTLPEWNKNEKNLLTQLPVNWAKLNK
ncbi:MAG TPA: YHS domain-containing (seleno)protein [Cyclobacteriaceae bacterium]|nr:YHS domain-containing (seleno)protein [Cyclobacteriaceae bacterium]